MKELIDKHPSFLYAKAICTNSVKVPKLYKTQNKDKVFISPKYVKKQCKEFINICEGKNKKYIINEDRVSKIDLICKLLKMPKGLKAGETIYNSLSGYQWLLIVASLCTVYRDDLEKRRYETVLLEIARKNGKTFIVSFLFILLFYLEPRFSRFFSVAPDGTLAKEIKLAIEPLIEVNKDILDDDEFKILRTSITHNPTKTVYTPLNTSTNRMDGREPNVFVADEVGALATPYPIEAMRSGQLLIKNKLGFLISTKYATMNNPFEDEVNYFKKVMDGIIEDDKIFGLLFEPNNTKKWTNDDNIILQANPLACEIDEVYEDLIDRRNKAIEIESKRENFLTKHCNIIYQGAGTEHFIDVAELQKCKVDKINWSGRDVFLGVDLAISNDNCAVGIVSDDDGTILIDSVTFIPEGRIEEKNQIEKINYYDFIKALKCIACGDKVVDYNVIEEFVFHIEEKYDVNVLGIGYDRFNAMSSAQKWETQYTTVQIRQHSDTLHAPTKLLYEKIMDGKLKYEENKLLEINFQNAKCVFDTNMNRYIHKKKSTGKVDMVFSILNALYLLQQDMYLSSGDFLIQF